LVAVDVALRAVVNSHLTGDYTVPLSSATTEQYNPSDAEERNGDEEEGDL
jgi:hypothetical protein